MFKAVSQLFSFRAFLTVELLEITELDSKASDCVVNVYVNAIKRKSKTRRIENGKVNFGSSEKFVFGGDRSTNEIVTLEDFLRVQVSAKDKIWKREIGAFEVRLAERLKEGEPQVTEWFRLQSLDGRETGKILIRLRFSGENASRNELDPNHNLEAINIGYSSSAAPISSNNLFRASIRGKPVHGMVDPRWLFRIRIHACQNLRSADTLVGTSDPFCEIQVKNEHRFTDVVFKELNPVFPNRTYEFGESLDVLTPNDDVLITVYDHDRLKSADFLGCLKLPIWALCGKEMKPQWFELSSKKAMEDCNAGFFQDEHKTRGKILVSAEFVPPEQLFGSRFHECSQSSTNGNGNLGGLSMRDPDRSQQLQQPKSIGRRIPFLRASQLNGIKEERPSPPQERRRKLPCEDTNEQEDGPHVNSTVLENMEARFQESVGIYKPYKNKIWLYRLEVTVLAVKRIDELIEVAIPVDLHEDGPANVGGPPVTTALKGKPRMAAQSLRNGTLRAPMLVSRVSAETSSLISRRSTEPAVPLSHRLSKRMFCELRCGGHQPTRYRTKACRDSRNPSWRGETFVCGDGPEGGIRVEHGSVGVAVMKKNGLGQDFIIGSVVVDLARLCRDMGYIDVEGMALTEWFDLRGLRVVDGEGCLPPVVGSIQLRMVLKPVSQTRVSTRESIALKLEHCVSLKGHLDPGEKSSKRHHSHIFARVRLEGDQKELIDVKETVPQLVHRNGEIHFDQMLLFDNFMPEIMRFNIALVDWHTGEEIGHSDESQPCPVKDDAKEELWNMVLDNDHVNHSPDAVRPAFQVTYRRMTVQCRRYLPVLGTMSLRLHTLRLPTHDFKHDIRVVVKYGECGNYLCTRVYEREVNARFVGEDSKFMFLVRNPHEEVEIEVRDVYGVTKHGANAHPLAGKIVARYSMTCFDVIESGFSQNSNEPKLSLPVHVSSRLEPGNFEISFRYNEIISALLSRNAKPLQVPVPPFSIERFAKELRRFARVIGWPYVLLRTISEILSWTNPIETVGCMVLLVMFCTIPAWTERPLVILPLILLAYLGVNYRKRMDGRFIASFITQSGSGMNECKHASLKICVVKAKNVFSQLKTSSTGTNSQDQGRHETHNHHHHLHFLHRSFPTEDGGGDDASSVSTKTTPTTNTRDGRGSNGTTDSPSNASSSAVGIKPMFVIKLLDVAKMHETIVGQSLPLERPTKFPDWSYRPASSFKPSRGSTLVSWRAGLHSHSHGLSQDSSDRVRFNLKSHQAFMCAIQRKPDESVLVVRLHLIKMNQPLVRGDDYRVRIGAKDAGEARMKYSKEVSQDCLVFEEDIICRIEPDEALSLHFGRSGDFFHIAQCVVEDPFHLPHNSSMLLPLFAPQWLGEEDESKNLTTRIFNTGSNREATSVGHVEVEIFHFYDQNSPGISQSNAPSRRSSFSGVAPSAATTGDIGGRGPSQSVDLVRDSLDSEDVLLDDFDMNFVTHQSPAIGSKSGVTKDRELSIPKKDFEQASKASIISWKRQPEVIVIELHDRSVKGPFLGRALLPLSKLVTDLDSLEQPVFHGWVKLEPRFDGTSSDRIFNEHYEGDGMVFVSAQVTLPIPVDESVLKDEREAKRAKFPHEKFAALVRQADRVYRNTRAFSDRVERIKNTLNWAVTSRTRLVLNITLVLFVLFALIPSRFIILSIGLYLFTEKFRPHGTIIISLNHLFALAPTDEDFSKVVSREIFGRVRRHHKHSKVISIIDGVQQGPTSSDDDSDHDDSSEDDDDMDKSDLPDIEGRLAHADAKFKNAIRQVKRAFPKIHLGSKDKDRSHHGGEEGARDPASQTGGLSGDLRSFMERRLGSIAQGYLRVLERHIRGVWFRRYFFIYDGNVVQYWARKKDFLNRLPSLGRLGNVTACQIVEPGSREAALAAENDALNVDRLFLLQQAPSSIGNSGVGSTFGNIFRHDMLNGRTLFAADCPEARDIWVKAFQKNSQDALNMDVDEDVTL